MVVVVMIVMVDGDGSGGCGGITFHRDDDGVGDGFEINKVE